MRKKKIETDKLHVALALLIVSFGIIVFGSFWYVTMHQEGYRMMDILKGSASHAVQKSQSGN